MKEIMEMSKKRRAYSTKTNNTTTFTTFSVKYLAHLMQALMCTSSRIKLLTDETKEPNLDIKKRVRFHIDMAMVASVGTHFKWTETLAQKLATCQVLYNVPNSLNLSVEIRSEEKRGKRERQMDSREREDEELSQCIDLLRELMPIGEEVRSMNELIGEVVSYVTCLQFQVGVLRSLVISSCDIK